MVTTSFLPIFLYPSPTSLCGWAQRCAGPVDVQIHIWISTFLCECVWYLCAHLCLSPWGYFGYFLAQICTFVCIYIHMHIGAFYPYVCSCMCVSRCVPHALAQTSHVGFSRFPSFQTTSQNISLSPHSCLPNLPLPQTVNFLQGLRPLPSAPQWAESSKCNLMYYLWVVGKSKGF